MYKRQEHGIGHKPGTVDIGVRVECRNEIMETVNRVLYESKLIGYQMCIRDRASSLGQVRLPSRMSP